jgi:hypothetical protein
MMIPWPVEDIPNPDSLFYRVPTGWLRPDLKVLPGVFKENKGSISTDWEKYSTAPETRARTGKPDKFAILRLVAGQVREIEGLTVSHLPIQNVEGQSDNRAHSDINGLESLTSEKPDLGRKEKIRTELKQRFSVWEIPPNAPVE